MDKNRELRDKEFRPKISVVMPTYNEEKRVAVAVRSILMQTFEDFEFIIIDDCSTDDTANVILSYANKDERIVFIQNEINVGYAENLNRGIKMSKSLIVARMDADDYSYPNRFEKQYNFLMENPDVDIVGTAARLVDRETGKHIFNCYLHETHEEIVKNKYKRSFNFHPSIMSRKALFIRYGGYDSSVLRAEEYHLWLKAYTEFKFHNLQEILLDYSVKSPRELLRFDYFISGLRVRVGHMAATDELLCNIPQLMGYIGGYLFKRIFSRAYIFESRVKNYDSRMNS